jgi:hypothetical protein
MKPKEFDAVNMMRELRDQLSKKYAKMTLQEEMAELQRAVPHLKKTQCHPRKDANVRHHQAVAMAAP